jgi:cell wall-associated NlpC family hydrolase
MRPKLLIPLAGAIALTTVCLQASAAPPSSAPTTPAIAAKKAQAARVLAEIASIDESLNTTSEEFDGARVRLDALRKNLRAERASLARARTRYEAAEQRGAKLLVWLYTSSHSDALDVILGANSLSELIRLSDAENAISKQASAVAKEAEQAKVDLEARVHALDTDRKAAQATVNELAKRRAQIEAGLAERRKLLVSVQAQVDRLEAQERARQARLAAEVAARLKAEEAARAKAAAEAAARAKAAAEATAAAQAKAAAAAKAKAAAQAAATTEVSATQETSTTTPTVSSETTTTTPAATTTPAIATTPTTTAPPLNPFGPSSPVLTGPLPAGHPDAATLALQYLGVPYLWGGSTPSGFDCSGLVTYVFAQLGVALPHFAAAQWTFGVPVTVGQLQPGDLVFFDALDHVGIYLGNDQFINAPHTGAFVRIDTLSEPWYAKHYVGARRV